MKKNKLLIYLAAGALGLLVIAGGFYGYLYIATPAHIRKPAYEHYHFRTQIIVDGQTVDFSQDKFQQEYDGNSCSVEISKEPIHFHDNIDQVTHIHWSGITGGEVLKYYGWNFIGDDDGTLGWHFGESIIPHRVPTYDHPLPNIPNNAKFYVYTGDENSYERKDWNDFLESNLENFFGKKSNLKQNQNTSSFNIFEWLTPKASAHGNVLDSHTENGEEKKTEEELTRINNLIGNVVIFVQKEEPSEEQIQVRFDNLVPLQDSTCGG